MDCISLTYPCGCYKCWCDMEASLDHFTIDADGNSSIMLNIITPPMSPVSKFRVTLVNYHSNVDKACLKCSTDVQEKYGTMYHVAQLFGANPEYAPYAWSVGVPY